MTDPSGSTRYCYDRRGNVARKIQATTGGPTRSLIYSYTAADRIATITYPSGLLLTCTRNAQGQITGVTAKNSTSESPVTLVTAATYQPFGPLGSLTFGNGRVLNKNYDLDYGIASAADSAANGLAIGYTLDDVGNVVGLAERQNGGATAARTVDYDGLDRLKALKNGATTVQGFTYDATGNRTTKVAGTSAIYVYEANSHRLTKVGTVNRGYDAAGNSTAIGTRAYQYDDRGRMASVRTGTNLTRSYRYNALGQRVAKVHPTTATSTVYFVYDEAGKLMGEYKPDGTLIREYLWLDDTLVAMRAGYATHKFQYVLTDHLNTPRAVVLPSTNAIIWRWGLTGSAFGDHAALNNPDGDTTTYTFNLRYPGQYFDSETGLHYNYFRDYDPSTGRYVQSDPIGQQGGLSTFSYVGSNPFLAMDPFGLLGWTANQTVTINGGIRTGTVTNLYPGAANDPAVTKQGARTTMDWMVSTKCGCDGVLEKMDVEFTPKILMRRGYLTPRIRSIVRRKEQEHVDDLLSWFNGAEEAANKLERDSMALPAFSSQDECESAADAAIRAFLEAGADAAARKSVAVRHANGAHNIPEGWYND